MGKTKKTNAEKKAAKKSKAVKVGVNASPPVLIGTLTYVRVVCCETHLYPVTGYILRQPHMIAGATRMCRVHRWVEHLCYAWQKMTKKAAPNPTGESRANPKKTVRQIKGSRYGRSEW
eukprot:1176006-Prorocentrum_minimum.AAC.6